MPCDMRIRIRLLDMNMMKQIAEQLGLTVTKVGDTIHINGKGINRVFKERELLNLSQSEIRGLLGKTLQEYSVQKTLESVRKRGMKVQKRAVNGKVEILVDV